MFGLKGSKQYPCMIRLKCTKEELLLLVMIEDEVDACVAEIAHSIEQQYWRRFNNGCK
eukprot:EC721366.1.p4 GENE.EC721366.1~~EC721366.1.p4  ORF type:complete len:58 (-),score=9.54 EC721366.1:155-328(-)